MIDGAIEHRDSMGGGGLITDGATQWMTAGAGILHSELPPQDLVRNGGLFHGVQLWVNLPRALKWTPAALPGHHPRRARLLLSTDDGGALVRIIAGELDGHAGPGVDLHPDRLRPRHPPSRRAARHAVAPRLQRAGLRAGRARHRRAEERAARRGPARVLRPGRPRASSAADRNRPAAPTLEVLLLGGLPIREPIAHYGPFVMNTREEILQAIEDYQAGRLGTGVPGSVPHRTSTDAPLDGAGAAEADAD